MLKAINYWTIGGFDGGKPIAQAIVEAGEMGFQALELCFGAGELTEETSEAHCVEIRRVAEQSTVKLRTMATGAYWGQSLSASNESVRQAAIDFTKHYLRVAAQLDVETVLVVPGAVDVGWDPSQEVVPYDQVWNRSRQSLTELLSLAEDSGVNIGIENVWNKFLLSPLEMRDFIDGFGSDRIGAYLDVGNVLLTGYPEHWIAILGSRIKAVHLKNFSREDSGGLLHGFGDDLLNGDVNWPAVMDALKSVDFDGPVTAEMIPFCRLPDLVLPDMDMARRTSKAMDAILSL